LGGLTLLIPHTSAFEDGPDRRFRNVGNYKPDAGNYPKESLLHSVHGESLKSRRYFIFFATMMPQFLVVEPKISQFCIEVFHF